MGQTFGDGSTGFQVHGSGFSPHTVILLSLNGRGPVPARDEPLTDPKGTFNYTIDQGHVFFTGEIPDGTYHVLAKSANGRQQATAVFKVQAPPGSPPRSPPPGPPPTGSVPPLQGLAKGSRTSPSSAARTATTAALPSPVVTTAGPVPSPSGTVCTHGSCCAHGGCRPG
jgi:hypothetical protein